jgi:putative drug exporter of the RND superfamily
VHIFALNTTVAMGFALAVDYTLLIINRLREEVAAGAGQNEALIRTMATAGRTVLFSALIVGLSTRASEAQLDQLHGVSSPAGQPVILAGISLHE